VIARVPTSKTVTAGESAEVSWFPNGLIETSTPGGGGSLQWCHVITGPSSSFTSPMPITTFEQSAGGVFSQTTAATWSGPSAPLFLFAYGLYQGASATLTGFAQMRFAAASGFLAAAVAPENVTTNYEPYLAQILQSGFEFQSPFHMEVGGSNTDNWIFHTYMATLEAS